MAKAGLKIRRERKQITVFVGDRAITFGAKPEELSEPRPPAPPKKRDYLKWQQEEILRRVRQLYSAGDIPRTAEVRRVISDKKFKPSYNTVHAALGRGRPKK